MSLPAPWLLFVSGHWEYRQEVRGLEQTEVELLLSLLSPCWQSYFLQ
jgi:hypothetical protein